MWYVFIIPFVAFFITFLCIAGSVFRAHKHSNDTMQDMVNTISAYAEKEVQQAFTTKHEETKTCEYCGSKISNNNSKCDSCGAKGNKGK